MTPGKLRIGKLGEQVGLSPKTIRYYERVGLLRPPDRSASGYRQYDLADVRRLRFILKAKAVGLTLAEIGEILSLRDSGESPCARVAALTDAKIACVAHRIEDLQALHRVLLDLRREARRPQQDSACVCGIIEHHRAGAPGPVARGEGIADPVASAPVESPA